MFHGAGASMPEGDPDPAHQFLNTMYCKYQIIHLKNNSRVERYILLASSKEAMKLLQTNNNTNGYQLKFQITEIETTFTLSGLPRTMAMKFLLIALLFASFSAKPKWSLIEVEDEAGVEDKGKTEDQNNGSDTPLVEPSKKGKDYNGHAKNNKWFGHW